MSFAASGRRGLAALLATAAVFAATTAPADIPLAFVGTSGDAWEAPWDSEAALLAQCNFPIAARWVAVPERNLKRVIGRLNASPSVELSDKDAAKLTGLTIERAGSLSASVFNREIERLVALQKSVEGTGVGSWTGIEQADLDELRAIMTGDRWRAYRPYLLRVLNHPGAVNVLNVDTCGANVRVFNVSDALLSTRPTHTAVVVFLHEPPKDILVSWGVNDRPK